jgi:hypoxanthine phosphoribosyltransferase
MTKKVYYSDADVCGWVHEIMRDMYKGSWRPDYVVGLTRGGLIPAVMISQYLDVPMETLKVSLRDSDLVPESKSWMAEDAFGYAVHDPMASGDGRKQILIVDDINDSGATLNWIKQDWQSTCLPNDPRWVDEIWHHNVRFAVLVNNEASEFKDVDYAGTTINKLEDPAWIVFPWEEWWR